ncbi:MAG: hypothetical protein LBR51_01260 [Bacteroidales bacterium]|jgi:hypothetical protein|nr:hypothetical protein [Bacteroidales bacterium]
MKNKNKISHLLVIFLMLILEWSMLRFAYTQNDSTRYSNEEDTWKDLIENMEISIDEVDLIDELSPDGEMLHHESVSRYNLNTLSRVDAFNILHLSEYQYYQLQLYIEKYGYLVTVYELGAIDGFSEVEVQRLLPRVWAGLPPRAKLSWKTLFKQSRHEILARYGRVLETRAGYLPETRDPYLGSPDRLLFRYKWTHKEYFSVGIAGEKDAGEEFFKGSQKQGFDHYSFHLQVKNLRYLQNLVLGDYRLQLGQGLSMGAGLLGGKGGDIEQVRKIFNPVTPVAAMSEGNYFRGMAAVLGNARYKGTLFYGTQTYDGTLENIDSSDITLFSGSLNTVTGYHRTETEISKKAQLREHTFGMDFSVQQALFKIGSRIVATWFPTAVTEKTALYQRYDFKGNFACVGSIDYHYLLSKTVLFGEVSLCQTRGMGVLQGIMVSPDTRLKLLTLFRYYSPSYVALHGHAFGANSVNRQERGLYFAARILCGKHSELRFYSDYYQNLWLAYRVDKPVPGWEMSLSWQWQPNKSFALQIRYLYKKKEMNNSDFQYYNTVNMTHRHKCRAEMSYQPVTWLKLKSSIESLYHLPDGEQKGKTGLLLYQDIQLLPNKIPLEIKGRLAFFNTDSYEERIYAYEHDLYGIFNMNSYYYRGWRTCLLVSYRFRAFHFWLRLSRTSYLDRQEISSGKELIAAPHKTEIKAQTVIRL